jgi:hypothetical protein
MYKITDKKVNIVFEYLEPYAKKYNAVVFFIEDYFPASIYEKQGKALSRFYGKTLPNGTPTWGDGFIEYLNLVEEYYNFKINIQGWGFSPGIADLPIPPNATFNKEFVEKAVSILRKYAGCEVPLVANFLDYRQRSFVPGGPSQADDMLRNPKPAYLSLPYLILLFVVIPTAILLPIILILRKVNNKRKR